MDHDGHQPDAAAAEADAPAATFAAIARLLQDNLALATDLLAEAEARPGDLADAIATAVTAAEADAAAERAATAAAHADDAAALAGHRDAFLALQALVAEARHQADDAARVVAELGVTFDAIAADLTAALDAVPTGEAGAADEPFVVFSAERPMATWADDAGADDATDTAPADPTADDDEVARTPVAAERDESADEETATDATFAAAQDAAEPDATDEPIAAEFNGSDDEHAVTLVAETDADADADGDTEHEVAEVDADSSLAAQDDAADETADDAVAAEADTADNGSTADSDDEADDAVAAVADTADDGSTADAETDADADTFMAATDTDTDEDAAVAAEFDVEDAVTPAAKADGTVEDWSAIVPAVSDLDAFFAPAADTTDGPADPDWSLPAATATDRPWEASAFNDGNAPTGGGDAEHATTVVVEGVRHAISVLSLKRHLARRSHVQAVTVQEYAEGTLTLRVISTTPLTAYDLRGWEGGTDLEIIAHADDAIAARLPKPVEV